MTHLSPMHAIRRPWPPSPTWCPTRPRPTAPTSVGELQDLKEEWSGQSLLAIGQRDPVLGEPVMRRLAATIQGCPEPLLIPEAGHFVQEWGEPIARHALRHFRWT